MQVNLKASKVVWKVKFDIDFDIKPVMTDDEKVAEHKLVGSLMAAEQKMGFTG